jgi:gamma-glutamyl:cysteine ligase YbdK (ATP-grasp superfamily)
VFLWSSKPLDVCPACPGEVPCFSEVQTSEVTERFLTAKNTENTLNLTVWTCNLVHFAMKMRYELTARLRGFHKDLEVSVLTVGSVFFSTQSKQPKTATTLVRV